MKIKCDVINDLLPLYVDDVLSDASRELVEEHIRECESCKKTLENMTGKVSIPVSPDLRKEDSKPIKGLKKIVTKWKGLTAAVAVLAVIVAGILFVMYATNKTIDIPYDGKNFTLELIDDKYCIVYHGEGSYGFSSSGDLETGVYSVEFCTTLLEKILDPVKPVYRKIFNVQEYDYIPLCNRGEITKLVTKEGKVIWQAGEEEMKEFERTKPAVPQG